MIDKAIISEVQQYLSDDRTQRYVAFCNFISAHCKEVADELGPNVVHRVYSRIDKQEAGAQLKSTSKIAKKVMERRIRGEIYSPADVRDIVGVTVVIQYPDQVDEVIACLQRKLNPEDIKIEVEKIERPGYYATHVDIFSSLEFRKSFCELQIKTMLHDAWSAKMHDLNYKPSGTLDTRLDRLMLSLGSTLQGLELQSETLRNLIHERWQHDGFWRQTVGKATIDQLRDWSERQGLFDEDFDALFKEIDASVDDIMDWRSKPDKLARFTRLVNDLSGKSARRGWWIAAYLAFLSRKPENNDFAIELVNEWITEATSALKSKTVSIDCAEIWFAPMACKAIGETEIAIEVSERIIALFGDEHPEDCQVAKFNLAHYLLEKEYLLPSTGDARSSVQQSIRQLLEESVDLRSDDESAFHDAEGMEKVVFGTNSSEIREGIDLIQRGRDEAPDHIRDFASNTFELHARMAWRKLAEFENATS